MIVQPGDEADRRCAAGLPTKPCFWGQAACQNPDAPGSQVDDGGAARRLRRRQLRPHAGHAAALAAGEVAQQLQQPDVAARELG